MKYNNGKIQESWKEKDVSLVANDAQFIDFYAIHGCEKLQEVKAFTRNAGGIGFGGYEECHLVTPRREVFFLRDCADMPGGQNSGFNRNLEYFSKRYVAAIGPNRPMDIEDCRIPRISLINYEPAKDRDSATYEVEIEFAKRENTKLADLWNTIIGMATQQKRMPKDSMLDTWIALNSVYKQLKPMKRAEAVSPALSYLESLQQTTARLGATHLTYDYAPKTGRKFVLRGVEFQNKAKQLAGKDVKASMYTDDIRKSVFFDPAVYTRMWEAESGNPRKINLVVPTDILLSLTWPEH
jgi:hypothetical protein